MATIDRIHCYKPYFFPTGPHNNKAEYDAKRDMLEQTWSLAVEIFGNEFLGPPLVEPKHPLSHPAPELPTVLHLDGDALIVEQPSMFSHPRVMWALMSAWRVHGGKLRKVIFRWTLPECEEGEFADWDWQYSLQQGWCWLYRISRDYSDEHTIANFEHAVAATAGAYILKRKNQATLDAARSGHKSNVTEMPSDFAYVEQRLRARLKKYARVYGSQIAKEVTVKWSTLTASQKEQLARNLVADGVCTIERSRKGRPIFVSKIHEVAA